MEGRGEGRGGREGGASAIKDGAQSDPLDIICLKHRTGGRYPPGPPLDLLYLASLISVTNHPHCR